QERSSSMSRDPLTTQLARWFPSPSRRVPFKKKPNSCQLAVEALEDRVVPTVGPVLPVPSNYPLQAGFTPITDISQITGPGNYQLTADSNGGQIDYPNVTLDGGGHTVGLNIYQDGLNVNGQGDVVKNCVIPVYVVIGHDATL